MATPESLQNLTVEFLGEDGGLHPASVQEYGLAERQLYLSFEDNWMENGWYRTDVDLYQAPRVDRDEVQQALANGVKDVEVFYSLRADAPRTWYPGAVVSENNGFYTIDLNLSKLGQTRRVTKPIEDLRILKAPIQLNLESIHRLQFPVDPKFLEEATSDRSLALLAKLGRLDYIRYEPPNSIIIMGYGKEAATRAEMLMYFHLQNSPIRQELRDEIEPKKQQLEKIKSAVCRVELPVPLASLDAASLSYVARKINRDNLPAACRLSGIISIVDKEEVFEILAANEEAAAQAQELLFHHTDVLYIDTPFVRFVVGAGGETIKTIQQRSNCALLRICDSAASLATSKLPLEWHEGCSALLLTGTKTETADARMLVECRIDHQQEINRLEKEQFEERQKAYEERISKRRGSKAPSDASARPSETSQPTPVAQLQQQSQPLAAQVTQQKSPQASTQNRQAQPVMEENGHGQANQTAQTQTLLDGKSNGQNRRKDSRRGRGSQGGYNGYNGYNGYEAPKMVDGVGGQQQSQHQQQEQQLDRQQPRKDTGLTNGHVTTQNEIQFQPTAARSPNQRNNTVTGVAKEFAQAQMISGRDDDGNLNNVDGEKVAESKKQKRPRKKGSSISSNGSTHAAHNEGSQNGLSVGPADPELTREDQVSR
ncbi:hypothetical protein RvY_00731 [Ramazzottius varieornatus]|uniref:K Homology domain-containing protein n=1 Tax=Ramazzottius varieornatus TaxID=947166 RepID=A0A1D1UDT7_RAMVA|nr:hypothetical protein RvY_00731 [Ramazzottius varieornatus]